MKNQYAVVCAVAIVAGLMQSMASTKFVNDIYMPQEIEKKAMNSLGYSAVTHTAAYPEDRFAMPEPFSSEQLVTYAMRIQEYKSNFAELNFNND